MILTDGKPSEDVATHPIIMNNKESEKNLVNITTLFDLYRSSSSAASFKMVEMFWSLSRPCCVL